MPWYVIADDIVADAGRRKGRNMLGPREERPSGPYITDDERLRIRTRKEVRRWLAHLAVFLVVQLALIPSGYSIFNPLVHLFGGPDRRYDLAYRLTEGWAFILLLDLVVVLSWPLWPRVREFIMDL